MKKQLQLSIPEPCHENWDKMSPNERGRHCSSCNKTIIDFSLYSDRQLIEFIEKAQGKICGRLSPVQVNRPITYTEPRNNFLYKLLFGSVLTVGITCSANANYNPNQKPLVEQYGFSPNDIVAEHPEGDTTKSTIKGIVADNETNEALPFAAVVLKNGEMLIAETYTDIDGKYSLKIPDSLSNTKLIIQVAYVGYEDSKKDFVFSTINHEKDFVLKLKSGVRVIMGDMVITIQDPPAFDRSNAWDKQTLRPNDTPYK